MSDKPLDLQQRVDALEAKITIIGTGLSAILTELAGVGEVEKVSSQAPWNPTKIVWTEAEGSKGPYERSEDVNSYDFKALIKDLADHNGKLTRGDFFYWLFQNGSTVGRKKRKR